MVGEGDAPFSLDNWAHDLWQDARFGFRLFGSSPTFTLVAVLTLALGIAVTSTVFSWIDGVLLHPYPGVTDTRGLALIEAVGANGEPLVATSYLDYRDYRDQLKLISDVAIGRLTPLTVGADGNTARTWAELVSANYFDVLRVKPALGRFFRPEEDADKPGAYPIAVISYRMWQNRYHGSPDVAGTTIRLNRHDVTIIGVAPPELRGSLVGFVYDVWMPIGMAPMMGSGPTLTYRACRDLTSTLVRLKPGVTLGQSRAEASAVAKRLAAQYPETNRGIGATVVPVWAGHLGAQGLLSKPLGLLMGVCVLLLIIVCANVANLLLARAVARHKELAVRLAFGARRGRLIRQMLTETLLLAAAGAAVGLPLVAWTGQLLNRLLPPVDFPYDLRGGLNPATVGFTLLLVVLSTAFAGLVPAIFSARDDLTGALNEGGRSGGGGTRSHRLRRLLVGVEVALAMVALVGAGLFARSFRNATRIAPGFDTRNVVVAQFYLSNAGYTAQEQRTFSRQLRQRLESVPGVTGVTYTDFVPLTSPASSPTDRVDVEGYVPAPDEQTRLPRATVAPGYFELMGIPRLEGRDFAERDEAGAPPVMIVNESFARRYFGGHNPIGRTVRVGGTAVTVVGEVRDSKYDTPMERPAPYFYLPFRQSFFPGLNVAFLVRTAGDPMLAVPELRRQALSLNQDAAFHAARLTDAIGYSLYAQTIAAGLLTVVGSLCLLLAAIGLYSVISYSVSQRAQELGVRMALGAGPLDIVGMVVRESLLLALPGLLLGLALALAVFRSVSSMLVGVRPSDPLTIGAAAAFLLAVTLAASYWPARRAERVAPMGAVRCQ